MGLTQQDSAPRQTRGAVSATSLQLTVTGTDADGTLFRETATLVRLQGKNCTYRSKHRVPSAGWLMVEVRRGSQDKEIWRAGAQVKSSSPDGPRNDLFQVSVELDRAHDSVVVPTEQEEKGGETPAAAELLRVPAATLSVVPGIPAEITATPPGASELVPDANARWVAEVTSEDTGMPADLEPGRPRQPEAAAPGRGAADETSRDGDLTELAARVSEVSLPKVAEMIHNGLVVEYERRMAELKTTISAEVEKAAQDILTARMAGILEAAVETRMAQYTETLPAITDKVVEQLAGRLAKIPQLEASLDSLSKGLTERWSETTRKATQAAQQNVSVKIAEIEELAKRMVGDLESKLGVHRAELQSILELSHTAIGESTAASLRAQETMKCLSDVLEAATPLMDASLRERVENRSAEFTNKIDHIVVERAAKFMSEIELLLASRIESANQSIQELAAQLLKSEELLRTSEERLRSQVAAAGILMDQEIKGVLRRLAGTG